MSWVSTVALGVLAGGFSMLLGAGLPVAAISAVTTALIDRVGRLAFTHCSRVQSGDRDSTTCIAVTRAPGTARGTDTVIEFAVMSTWVAGSP